MLYLCGSIAGISDARAIFKAYKAQLEEVGYEVLNPYDVPPIDLPGTSFWSASLRGDIAEFLRMCVGVATIDGWQKSPGASLEVEIASRLEIPVMPVAGWLSSRGRMLG